MQKIRRAAAAALFVFMGATCVRHAIAHDADEAEEVRVIGHSGDAPRASDAASQGEIGAEHIAARPLSRPAEALESVPGAIVTQHSGEGKASQYFLRGFNLDHGTDFRTTVEHMPINLPTHAHGQGYTDLNFVIPELISRVAYTKGPYFAEQGDFASAGSADIHYASTLPQSIASVGAGNWGYRRALLAGSSANGAGQVLYAAELLHNDGPWQNPDDYNKTNGVLRYSQGSNADGFSLTGMIYRGKWNATDQVPQRALDSGMISRFGAIDASDGGESERTSLSLDRHKALGRGMFHFDAYVVRYRLKLFSNFTYYLRDPVNGDQFEQSDERTVFGMNPKWILADKWAGRDVTHKLGFDLRHDAIDVALYNTAERTRLSTVRSDKVDQTGLGLYYENKLQWSERFRTVAGLREDFFRAKVDSDLAANSGTSEARIASPKINFIYVPAVATEVFLNYGHGFHSNDARGTTITRDPVTLAPARQVPALVKTKGAELGARTEAIPGLQSSLVLWRLALASELVFSGDAGTTEPGRASLRRGVEWTNRYILRPGWIANFDLASSRARYTESDPAGDLIPGAIEKVATLGLALNEGGRWSASANVRYFGPRPLVEDNSVRSRSSTLASLRASYKWRPRIKVDLDILNLFNRRTNDIDYYYASQLRGETAPVNDLHSHPAEPRTLRVALVANF